MEEEATEPPPRNPLAELQLGTWLPSAYVGCHVLDATRENTYLVRRREGEVKSRESALARAGSVDSAVVWLQGECCSYRTEIS